jgi:uncharacterized cupredoxin-like copper-binding protein
MSFKSLLAVVAGLVFSANVFAADYVTNYKEIVKNADWKAMQTVEIEMEEFAYSMDEIKLKAGVPYKLVLKNKGEKKHYFTAPEFYKKVAWRKVMANKDGEIKAPYFDAIEVLAGGQIDLYFVTNGKGTFPVFCTIDDHQDQGMEGEIIVQ